MAQALNQGQPIVMRDRNHPISKAIIKLARYLGTEPASGSPQTSAPNSPAPVPSQRAATWLARLMPGQAAN